MTVNELAKLTIVEVSKRNLLLTPENYNDVFNELAKKHGLVSHEMNKVDTYINRLNPNLQKELKDKHVKSIEEVLSFAIAKSNFYDTKYAGDSKKEQAQNKLNQTNLLLEKHLLRVIDSFKYKKTSDLVAKSLERLNNPNLINLDEVKNLWMDFLATYDENLFFKLKAVGINTNLDLESLIEEVYLALLKGDEKEICSHLVPSFVYSLTPSIASKISDEIGALCNDLKKDPELLNSKSAPERIREAVKKRIELDQQEISSNNTFLYQILDSINQNIERILSSADESCAKIELIRKEVAKIPPNPELSPIKDKFLDLISSFEGEVKVLRSQTQTNMKYINELQDRVICLQNEVKRLKQENTQDFLTKILNKKAIEEQLKIFEQRYQKTKKNYSVCVMDIDHFKSINDTYGHNAGDLILASLGGIFKEQITSPHVVGRFGGEEFVLIFDCDSNSAGRIVESIRAKIKSYDFIYKSDTINITISGGICDRSKMESGCNPLDIADKFLYDAKKAGRDRLVIG